MSLNTKSRLTTLPPLLTLTTREHQYLSKKKNLSVDILILQANLNLLKKNQTNKQFKKKKSPVRLVIGSLKCGGRAGAVTHSDQSVVCAGE